jgi:hypothetical protein
MGGGFLAAAGAGAPVAHGMPQLPFTASQPQLPLQLQLQLLLNGASGGARPTSDASDANAGPMNLHAAAAASAIGAGGVFPVAAAGGLLSTHQHTAAAAAAAAAAAVSTAACHQQYLEPAAMALAAGWGNARYAFDAAQSFGPAAVRAMLPQTLNAVRTGSASDLGGGGSDSGSSTAVKKTRRGCRGGRRKHWYLAQQMAVAGLGPSCPPPGLEHGFGALVALPGARQ